MHASKPRPAEVYEIEGFKLAETSFEIDIKNNFQALHFIGRPSKLSHFKF